MTLGTLRFFSPKINAFGFERLGDFAAHAPQRPRLVAGQLGIVFDHEPHARPVLEEIGDERRRQPPGPLPQTFFPARR